MADHIRHGFGAARPYLYGDQSTIDVILAIGGTQVEDASGHRELRVGDSMIVVEVRSNWPATQARQSVYVYVPDVDAAHAAAVASGASSVETPADKPYKERASTIRDGFGNTWYLSTYSA